MSIIKTSEGTFNSSKSNVHSVADILLTGTVMRNVVSLQLLTLYNQYLLSYITRKEEDISYVMTNVYIPFNFWYPCS